MATEALAFRPSAPVSIFISYSHRDEALKNELLKHLSLLKRQGIISHWHDREIRAGADWSIEIDSHLESAQIILLLVSSDFLASDYCYEKEMKRALERHGSGEARVIPIFLRPCDWTRAPFGQVQGLPLDAKPITDWENPDSAFSEVAKSIRMIAEHFHPATSTIEGVAPEKRTALHQLPPSSADFTGRVDDITELIKAVREKQARILGIFGMGGLGKTALALNVADQLKDDYPDGQIYLDLKGVSAGPLQSKDAMAHVIRSFDLTSKLPELEPEIVALYRSVLHGRKVLLLMDNAADEKQVEALIPSSSCLLLITSRMHFTLPGLVEKNLDAMTPEDAKALLLRIAARLKQAEEQCIADLASFCGYLPLALRMAANALQVKKSLKPAEYVRRLQDANLRLGELKEVEASLQVSYDLLSERMQTRFCHLSVFPDAFDAGAASAVWEINRDVTEESLEKLLLYSLIEFNESTDRYTLHDLVRLFADTRIGAEARKTVPRLHAAHYLAVLDRADELFLHGRDSMFQGLTLFDAEWPNIQKGQAFGARGTTTDQMRLCIEFPLSGANCLALRLRPSERIDWLAVALDAARKLEVSAEESALLTNLGNAYRDVGEYRRAIECLEQSLEIARQLFRREGEAHALIGLGSSYLFLGDYSQAIDFYEQALVIYRKIGELRCQGIVLGNLGSACWSLGQYSEATRYHEQHLEIARRIGDRYSESIALGSLGNAYHALGNQECAIEHYHRALAICREIKDRRGEARDLGNLSNVYNALGNHQDAFECCEQALQIARDIGDRHSEGTALWNESLLLSEMEDMTGAIVRAEAALEILEQVEDPDAVKVRSWLAYHRPKAETKGQAAE